MSKKIEKLREVNATLNSLLNELETRMFIENINVSKITDKKEKNPVITVGTKQ